MDGYTNTNHTVMRLFLQEHRKIRICQFGDTITGTVSANAYIMTTTHTKIPADGFVYLHMVLRMEFLKYMKVGEQVQISNRIDEKWKGAKYIMASGPRLVDNGAVSLSISPKSSRATERAPRTAIAVDRTLSKVFIVTVDGRQTGYRKG